MRDITKFALEAKPWDGAFSYMDALVLAQFAYLPFGVDMDDYSAPGINPWSLTIRDFSQMLLSRKYAAILKHRFGKDPDDYQDYREFCRALALSDRYGPMVIYGFSIENNPNSQYVAFCISLGSIGVVCCRGTDGTYSGWHENFQMLDGVVAAQKFALEFLDKIAPSFDALYVTGHSKGGNLAAFSGILSQDVVKGKILGVYNFDGPGFNRAFMDTYKNEIKASRDKMFAYMPENSIVGELLYGQKETYETITYVEAGFEKGILYQHSLFMWKIKDGDLIACRRSALSKTADVALDHIIDTASKSQINLLVKLFLLKFKK